MWKHRRSSKNKHKSSSSQGGGNEKSRCTDGLCIDHRGRSFLRAWCLSITVYSPKLFFFLAIHQFWLFWDSLYHGCRMKKQKIHLRLTARSRLWDFGSPYFFIDAFLFIVYIIHCITFLWAFPLDLFSLFLLGEKRRSWVFFFFTVHVVYTSSLDSVYLDVSHYTSNPFHILACLI